MNFANSLSCSMLIKRIIPVLLSNSKSSLVKTRKFKNPVYVGDPFNAVKIFNDKEVDELIYLDINAGIQGRKPDFSYIYELAGECFMPLCYGGGITTLEDITKAISAGVEKVAINSAAAMDNDLISKAADKFGSSTIVVSIDVGKNFWGNDKVYTQSGKKNTGYDPLEFAKKMEIAGAGELLLNSIDRDGEMNGYDTELIKKVAAAVNIPVIACGGAGNLGHFREAFDCGASAAAAGSMFVFTGKHRAVLINYPSREEINSIQHSKQ